MLQIIQSAGVGPAFTAAFITTAIAVALCALSTVFYKARAKGFRWWGFLLVGAVTFLSCWTTNMGHLWNDQPIMNTYWRDSLFGWFFFVDSLFGTLFVIIFSAVAGILVYASGTRSRSSSDDDDEWSRPSPSRNQPTTSGSKVARSFAGTFFAVAFLIIGTFGFGSMWGQTEVQDGHFWPFDGCNYQVEYSGQLKVDTNPSPYTPTSPTDIPAISAETAKKKANNYLAAFGQKIGQSNINSFAQEADSVNLERDAQDNLVYIVGLQINSNDNWKKSGLVVNGFMVVSATDPKALPQVVVSRQLYVPGGDGQYGERDIMRTAYLNGVMGGDSYIDTGLTDGMEAQPIDQQVVSNGKLIHITTWHPYYTGLLLHYTHGDQYSEPEKVILFDPTNGKVTLLPVGAIDMTSKQYDPNYAFINHALGHEFVEKLMNRWLTNGPNGPKGQFNNPCPFSQTADLYKLTSYGKTDVFTSTGMDEQNLISSTNSDTSLNGVLYVSLNTMRASLYHVTSATPNIVASRVVQAARKQFPNGPLDATECQLRYYQQTNVWFCYIEGENHAFSGYGLMTADNSINSDTTSVVIATTLQDGFAKIYSQIINGQSQQQGINTNPISLTTVTATVVSHGPFTDLNGITYCDFLTREYPGVQFQTGPTSPRADALCGELLPGWKISMLVASTSFENAANDANILYVDVKALSVLSYK